MKFDWVTRFRKTIPTVESVSSSEIYKNFIFLIEITILPFLRKLNFLEFYRFGAGQEVCVTLLFVFDSFVS